MLRPIASTCILSIILAILPTLSFASNDTTESGRLFIEQVGPEEAPDILGDWTLIRPGNDRFESIDRDFEFDTLPAGNYTFTAKMPEGSSALVEVYNHGSLVDSVDHPQITFKLSGGDDIRLQITYTFTRTGTVSVTSEPLGLPFQLKGPNDSEYTGTTPDSFENAPEGQYTVYFDEIEGCILPKPQSDRLVKDGRIALKIEIACEGMEEIQQVQEEQEQFDFVTVTIQEEQVILEDVPIDRWYAPFISKVAKAKILTGYSDRYGNPSGTFGPGDNVNIAQLVKVAHEAAGVDENKVRVSVQNERAKGQWYELYFASAESLWWDVYRDRRIDPARPATRAEVIVTLLRAFDAPRVWPKGKTFGDISPRDAYAAAIETAAADGLIDAGGNFRPNDPINRAELAKIVSNAIELYAERSMEIQGGSQ